VLANLDVHLVLDSLVGKAASIRLHFTPTHGLWLNQVERWLGLLTSGRSSVAHTRVCAALKAAIEDFLTAHNNSPKPFVWLKPQAIRVDEVS
jgi:hypothetical protein